ncbi:hypothetical protein FE634_05645 [Nocardioides dongxiaopingii]|uniref:hypothetical protein n=1 Tax=Nocardioides sp. S-1144 TaxID=2582905 RepID=UPI00116492B3|nr:hypothetical protein [Nocardioides sp. S-1144]QCW50018.2 hypothetical protein FE634_05645 [Nocardioides sp. S-1144]
MMGTPTPRSRRRPLGALGALVLVALLLAVPSGAAGRSAPAAPGAPGAPAAGYEKTRTLTRTFVDAQGQQVVDSTYDVTVTADQTTDLRGRQRVEVSWSGARPSAGRASNPYGVGGLQQEYPVVVLQCRGRDDATLPPDRQLRPETCWTSAYAQRSQVQKSIAVESTWTKDLYADPADKQRVSGMEPLPDATACPTADTDGFATHLTEFVSAAGTVFPACDAEQMPPEAAVGGAFPPAEVAAFTDLDGNGSVQFEVRSNVENESLGCSHEVDCSIVVLPIVGLSCDQEAAEPTRLDRECRSSGVFGAGSSNFTNLGAAQAVSPSLWWSASNWRHRFTIPITFGLPPSVCDVLDSRSPVGFYGSELLAQAALQWAPAYCLDEERFKFELNQMSDIAGFNLMQEGRAPAAVVSSEHERTGGPVGYAPTALTGFGIGYVVDRPDNAGELTDLRLTPRLIAKLLTQSYLGSDLGRGHPGMTDNLLAIVEDPEFQALNRGLSTNAQEAAATLLALSDDSDVIQQLTEYIAQDRAAMAFVRGRPDESGMVVNPSYRGIELPRAEWPLLDTYVPETQDVCRTDNPAVYFNQLAAPVTRLRQVAEAVLDGWPNVQTRCERDPATGRDKTGRVDQQSYGSRFMLGIVSLGDAARYGLRVARLRTAPGTFVAPTERALGAAIGISEQAGPRRPFALDQADVVRNRQAYPGTMVVYTAARTRGLEKDVAADVASFIRIATTEGQRQGSGNGRLPGGFVPIRATGPTAKLLASAREVADAVEAQTPRPAEPTEEPDVDDGGGGGTQPPGVTPTEDDLTPPSDPVPSAAPTTTAPEVVAEVDDEVVPTAATASESSGLAGALFPVLLGVGLLALVGTVGSRFFVRPPRSLS